MENKPFSVAISVYKNDNPIFFDRALESITTNQTIKPNEVVLVVDGPVPNEIDEVINKYKSLCNLNVIRLEKNGGLGNALKIATENCSYELIARMDSDDVAMPNRFEIQLKTFDDNENIDILGSNISEFIDDEANVVSYRVLPSSDEELKKFTKKRCPFNHMTVMFKKSSIMSAGGYVDWHYNEDYYLWIRMALNNCKFFNIDTILVNVRTGRDQYKRRGGIKYYKSEKELQKFMLKNKLIGLWTYFNNCFKRFIVQVLLPKSIRGVVFRLFARKRTAK